MQRFFVEVDAFRGDGITITSQTARQICDVLRLGSSEKIIVLDGEGTEYIVSLTEVSRRQVKGKVISKQKSFNEPKTQITLFQALTAREKFEHILQKCTEVGVVRFVPVITQRSIVRSGDKITDEKLNRRRAIIKEAAEQSGRGIIPQIVRPVSLTDASEQIGRFDLRLVGSPVASATSLKQILHKSCKQPVNIALFIGPEGGFSDSEIQLLQANGAVAFGLGRRILRTETASPVASAIILYELED